MNDNMRKKESKWREKKMKINNRMLVFLLVCSSNIEIYPIGVEKKEKKNQC
jgi:hypothetical protein